MEKDSYRQATQLFHMLSHPARLHILDELRRGEACVCHLQALLGRPQPYISQQLQVLRNAGVIESRKVGQFVYYRLADPHVGPILEEMLGPAGEAEHILACACPRCQKEEVVLPSCNVPAMEVE